MTMKIAAVLLLALALSACEPSSTDSNNNANTAPKASPTAATSGTPGAEASPAATASLKAGDKVKVTANGSSTEATVVSVDEKAGKVTVKVQGEAKDKTVPLSDVHK